MSDVQSSSQTQSQISQLIDAISPEEFLTWYRDREYRRNIQQGTEYFNGPSKPQPPERHSPSRLLNCHRKTVYSQQNAPEETADPAGIYWIGTKIEEEIALPYLREAVVDEDEYVTNSLWVDFTIDTDDRELRIKGETDPVIVTSDAEPLLLTEIKTKDSVENTTEPNTHHLAQAHAYMKGLSEKHDQNVTESILLYLSRDTLDIKVFHVKFDPWFWRDRVIRWAATNTAYRENEDLPPAAPEFSWECNFCPYEKRCGQTDDPYKDIPPTGLLPLTRYPRQKVEDYLNAHPSEDLTPSLAHYYPDLVEEYSVADWQCEACGSSIAWDEVEWQKKDNLPPSCPQCADEYPGMLSGPSNFEQ